MKVQGSMPVDYQMSIEARPLRVLYSKYNSVDNNNNALRCVRPLGSMRGQGSAASKRNDHSKLSSDSSKLRQNHAERKFGVSEYKMINGSNDLRGTGGNNHITIDAERKTEGSSIASSVGRSKARAFEHKFKIAAARANGQESPPLKRVKDYNKKVIHLPLFRINLKTYKGDSEINKAVKNTRENLRLLMEMHRSNFKPLNVKAANITNFEFNAPPGNISARSNESCERKVHRNMLSGYMSSPSFFPKPALKSPRIKSLDKKLDKASKSEIEKGTDTFPKLDDSSKVDTFPKKDTFLENDASPKIECQFCAMEMAIEKSHFVADDQGSSVDYKDTELRLKSVNGEDHSNTDEDPDISMLSIAMRPDTPLTLGSTINEIDRVLKSPASDELREISSVLRSNEPDSTWPSYDELMKMRSRNQSRRTKDNSRLSVTRPDTVQGTESQRKMYSVCSYHSTMNTDMQRPVMRYTSRPISLKPKPIVVPSHTCTECSMCNIYNRDKEGTPCPPNSPTPSIELQESPVKVHVTKKHCSNESGTNKPRSGASDKVRERSHQEVMHLARVNVVGELDNARKRRTTFNFIDASF